MRPLIGFIGVLAFCLSGCEGGTEQQNTRNPFDRFLDAQKSPTENMRLETASDIVTNTANQFEFQRCRRANDTCVVDGDTIWFRSEKIRVADIDTPEVRSPSCTSEKVLGERATDRLIALLNEGPFEIVRIGNKDEDQYGRKLRVFVRNGESIGDQLVKEGLARTWSGKREPWC